MTQEQAMQEALARIEELETDLQEMTEDRDYWEGEHDTMEALVEQLQCDTDTAEATEPVAYRASSIREAIEAIPVQVRQDPRWRHDFSVLEQCVTSLST